MAARAVAVEAADRNVIAGEVVIVMLAKVPATVGPWQLRQFVTPWCVPGHRIEGEVARGRMTLCARRRRRDVIGGLCPMTTSGRSNVGVVMWQPSTVASGRVSVVENRGGTRIAGGCSWCSASIPR